MADPVEIRCDLDRKHSDVIDAVSKARGVSRSQQVIRILGEWAEDRLHESIMVQRITHFNGNEGES